MNEENQLEREAGVRSKLHEKYEPWAFFSVFTVWQPHIRKKMPVQPADLLSFKLLETSRSTTYHLV